MSPAPPSTDAPLSVGGYRLGGLIGRGEVGEVHLAVDEGSGESFALKLMRLPADAAAGEGMTRDEARRAFFAQAQAAALLQHENIVRVHASGETQGLAWLAMELLPGCDLQRYTRPARLLPEPVAVRVAERLAHALAYAHGQGVLHRDVKPANVMVDWASGRVTLTDFGLARLADAERTRTGLVLGSPSYMAPEQLAGAAASSAGDVYALGVTLFQLLAGRLPHDSPSLGELLRQVAVVPAPDLRMLRPELPPALAAIAASTLAKRAAERPAAAELAQRLGELRVVLEAAAGGAKSRV